MLLAALLVLSSPSQPDPLAAGFANPPGWARPHTWWHWMDGNVTKEGITADLEAMKEVGIGGAQMFTVAQGIPKGPVDYMSPLWRDLTVHAIKEAGRLGIELCIHNCAGWSSSGGPWVEPENAMQTLAFSTVAVRGPGAIEQQLPPVTPQQIYGSVDYRRDIAVLAYPAPQQGTRPDATDVKSAQIIDVTRFFRNGKLSWEAPPGEWTILRIGHVPTGKDNHPAPEEGRGLEVDKMSRAALDDFWQGTMATVIKDAGPLAGKVLNNALVDSYEVGDQNWTPLMREEFIKRRGYDPLPWLPVIAGVTIESKEMSDRFLWDWRRTIADLFADNYFGYFGELCRKNGLQFSTEPYGGPFDNIQAGGTADIPMGEFWIGGGMMMETTKLASSVAHVYGRKIVGAEAFTADNVRGRWLEEPYSAKTLGDLAFANGINRYIFHRYAHQPWMDKFPGMTMGPWGTHLERTQTWWTEAREWMKYVARCQYMLQQGQFVADVLYFTGEGAPNDLPARQNLRPRIPTGYDYDGCDTFSLMRLTVRDGKLVLPSGMSYSVLVFPESATKMTPEVARKVRDLVADGATVVAPKPTGSPSLVNFPACDTEVRRIAEQVWGDIPSHESMEASVGTVSDATTSRFGEGQVVWGVALDELFFGTRLGPDFRFASLSGGSRLSYIHRRIADADVYFVSNQQYRSTNVSCEFRVGGRIAELWHPDTGKMEVAPVSASGPTSSIVQLYLDPAESVFVVFRRAAQGSRIAQFETSLDASPANLPTIEIKSARYETTSGRGADVTETVRQMVKEGNYEIPATNAVFGDPVVNVVKQLTIVYTLDGKEMKRTVPENGAISLIELPEVPFEIAPYRLEARGDRTYVAAFKQFAYTVWAGTSSKPGNSVPSDSRPIVGPWQVAFAKGWGAPDRVTLEELLSWTEHSDPGVKYFSGSAVYSKAFEVPPSMLSGDRLVLLDLGKVKNFATVTLNGKDLGVLWKEPFVVDVTGAVKAGRNELRVKVTNLWVNRIIGDEQLPADVEWNGAQLKQWPQWLLENQLRKSGRYTFTTWRFWDKDSPLLESGLIGPVVLRSARWVELRP